jgi:CxxC motif-containing protein (DUF1111 family)
MIGSPLARVRRRVGFGLFGITTVWLVWTHTPGLPVFEAPTASADAKAAGSQLFVHEWQPNDSWAGGDGLGPVFNDRSCVACHFQGGAGGGGDSKHNVTAFEALPAEGRPQVQSGVIHAFAIASGDRESVKGLQEFFPIVPGGQKIVGGCSVVTRDFNPVHTDVVNTTALFGAGWIDRISAKTILYESRRRSLRAVSDELGGKLDGVRPGRPRVLADGRVGKFGWKAQFATLEDFVAAACANELGLGNPKMEQARPWTQAAHTNAGPDLDDAQFRALVAYVDTLPRPVEILPDDQGSLECAERGKAVFSQIGCALCHTPDLGGVQGVYSDFLLHRLSRPDSSGSSYDQLDGIPIPLPDEHPLPDEWKTPALWGVADSAPYFHDGASPTLESAIPRHEGNATPVTRLYMSLVEGDRKSLIAFLTTLKAPAPTSGTNLRAEGIVALTP